MKKTVLITGASGSMGSVAASSLAAEGWDVIMAVRNPEKGRLVRDRILESVKEASVTVMHLDLGSLASVRKLAAELDGRRIDVLFNNAGTINRTYGLTEDGYERTFQVNCLGALLLMDLLKDNLGKVVSMVSLSCHFVHIGRAYQGDSPEKFSQIGSYARSKLALMKGTLDFSKRTGIPSSLADPLIVDTEIIRLQRWFDPLTDLLFRPFISSPAKGVEAALRAIRSDRTGLYYVGRKAITM